MKTDTHHLANSSLQNGIEPALRRVAVPRHHLLLHLLVEAVHFVGQWEDVAEAEGGDTVGEQLVSGHREQAWTLDHKPTNRFCCQRSGFLVF